MKNLLNKKELPQDADYTIVALFEDRKVITSKPITPELTITIGDITDTSIILLTCEKTASVKGDVVWTSNLSAEIVKIDGNALSFLQHYNGEMTLTATATNATASKTISVTCDEVATATTYTVKSISSPSVAWSSTEATISFIGIITEEYKLKPSVSVESQQTQVVTFEQNKPTTDKPMEFTANTEYVDLGLPSGLKWAKCNLGAQSETEYGAYFQWGDTNGYATATDKDGISSARNITDSFDWNGVTVNYTVKQGGVSDKGFSWPTVPFNGGASSYDATYFASVSGTVCPNNVLASRYDAATANMGGDWRMPTQGDFSELTANTTTAWVTDYNGSGINGRLLTSRLNGNKLFIPANGYAYNSSMSSVGSKGNVWSSSLYASTPGNSWGFYFGSSGQYIEGTSRSGGFSVRGVTMGE